MPEIGSPGLRLGAMAVGVMAFGARLGHPVAAAILAVAIVACFAIGRTPAVFACCVVVSALGSAAVPEIKDAGLTIRWLALGVLAAWPLIEIPGGRFAITAPRLVALGSALCGWALATTLWSAVPSLTAQRTAAFACLLWVAMLVAPQVLDDEARRRWFLRWLAVACLGGASAALAVAAAAPSTGRPEQLVRGWLENSNTMGLWAASLVPAIPILIPGWRKWLALALPVAVVVLSASRSAFAVLAVVLLLELPVSRRARWTIACIVVLAVAAAAISPLRSALPNTGIGKLDRTEGGVDRAITGARNEAWEASWTLAGDALIEGYGFGTGDQLFRLSALDQTFLYYQGANSGSSYITTLLEVGAIGLGVLVLLLWSMLRSSFTRPSTPTRRALRRIAVSVLCVALVESFLTSPGSPFAVLGWLSLGLVALSAGRDRTT